MTNERPLDPPANQERDDYYCSLCKDDVDAQLEALDLDMSDFVEWVGDGMCDLLYTMLTENEGRLSVSLFYAFISSKRYQAMKIYDLEGLPYEGQ